MNKIIQACGVEPASEKEMATTGDLVYESPKYIIRVYKGFRTDGGSLRWWMSLIVRILPFDPRILMAFILHDFIYRSHLLSRAIGDRILWDVMKIKPSPNFLQRWIIWFCVRIGAYFAYWSKSDKDIKEARKFGEIIYKGRLKGTVIK